MVTVRAANGVTYLKSELLVSPHGFSTRIGGMSGYAYTASLNLAFGRGDSRETVLENLDLFAGAVGIDPRGIVSAPQIHSATVRILTSPDRGRGYYCDASFECDGYVTAEPDVAPGVKTADCVPVLLEAYDERGAVFAVSALHAGWRGTAKNIVASGVGALVRLGASPERIRAAIGPSIGQCCFEVDGNCRDELSDSLSVIKTDDLMPLRNGKYFPGLSEINRRLLVASGLLPGNIEVCRLCTFCNPELFYSHRRTGGKRGTMLSVISLSRG